MEQPAPPGRYFIITAPVAIYIALRFWGFTASCLWFDEIFSIHAAEHPWNTLLDFVAQDLIHPPLFYILLKGWISIGGESLAWLRFFPIFFSVIAIVPFFLLCRELKLRSGAVALALFIFAVNGSLIKYAQEVRMYAPLLCFSLFSLWLFVRGLRSGKSFIFLTVVNLLMVYTHYFGWLVVLSEIAAVAWLRRDLLKKAIVMSGVVLLGFVPWIVLILKAAPAGDKFAQNIGWMQRPGLITIAQFILNLIEPLYYKASSTEYASYYLVTVPLLGISIAAAVVYFKKLSKDANEELRIVRLLLAFAVVPVLVALAASWTLPYSVWGTRHLIIVFVPVALLVAHLVENSGVLKVYAFAAFAGLSVMAFVPLVMRSGEPYIWCGWENLARQVKVSEPSPVYVFEDLSAYHFWFAVRGAEGAIIVSKLEGLQDITEDKAYFLPRGFDSVKRVKIDDLSGDTFWVAFRATRWDISKSPLSDLAARGYSVELYQTFEAGRERAYLALVRKEK